MLLKGTFGGRPDSIYPAMRKLIKENSGGFPLKEIIAFYRGSGKSISFNHDEIDNLLELQYAKSKAYCALTLMYPSLNHSFKYAQDHIHPKSKFYKKPMKADGFSDEEIKQFNAEVNGIANLQLLTITENQEKKDKSLEEWLTHKCQNKTERDRYLEQHHIRPDQSLEFKDFLDFVAERRKIIKEHLKRILGVTHDE